MNLITQAAQKMILPEIKRAGFFTSRSYLFISDNLSKIAYSLLFLHVFSMVILGFIESHSLLAFLGTLPGLLAVPLSSWHVVRKLDHYSENVFENPLIRSSAEVIMGMILIAWVPGLFHSIGNFPLEMIERILELLTIIISIAVMSGLVMIALGLADLIYLFTNNLHKFSHKLIVLLIITGLGTFLWLSFVGLQIHSITEWAVRQGHLEVYVRGLEDLSRYAGFYIGGIAGALSMELPFLVLLAWRFGNRSTSGIHLLSEGFKRALVGDYKTPVPVIGNDEISVMQRGFNELMRSADETLFLETAFGQYVSPVVLEELRNKGLSGLFQGERKNGTVVFSDICGFTAMSSDHNPEEVISILNKYMSLMIDVIHEYDGYINKFVGDAIMILFNAPLEQKDHVKRSLACAIAMQKKLKKENMKGLFNQIGTIEMSIGINTGPMVMGNLGNERQTEFTVIGDTVNVASRACSHAKAGEIVITENVFSELKKIHKNLRLKGAMAKVKGKGSMKLYTLKAGSKILEQLK